MNTFTDFKVFTLGQWIKNGHEDYEPFQGTWTDFIKSEEFINFKKRREITDKQIAFIKKGFMGFPFENVEPIMPFGVHINKRYSEIPEDYFLFLNKQSWITKWPEVAAYCKKLADEKKENEPTKEEIKELLKL